MSSKSNLDALSDAFIQGHMPVRRENELPDTGNGDEPALPGGADDPSTATSLEGEFGSRSTSRVRSGPEQDGGVSSNSGESALDGLGFELRLVGWIDRGPLKDDRVEFETFCEAVIGELNPGNSELLRICGADVALHMWRQFRVASWEAEGYGNAQLSNDGYYWPDWEDIRAQSYRRAAKTLWRLDDESLTVLDLNEALRCLLREAPADSGVIYNRMAGMDREGLLGLIDEAVVAYYASLDEAANLMEAVSELRRDSAADQRSQDRSVLTRIELAEGFADAAVDLVGKVSRELDRALARYWDLKDRLIEAESTLLS